MQPSRIERVTEVIEYGGDFAPAQTQSFSTRDQPSEPIKRTYRETRSGYSRSPIKATEATDYSSKDRTYVIGYGSPLDTNKKYENEVVHRSITKENHRYDGEGSLHNSTQHSAKRYEGTYSKSPLRKDAGESRVIRTQYSGRREPDVEQRPVVTRYYEEIVERKNQIDDRSDTASFDRREHYHPLRIEDESPYEHRHKLADSKRHAEPYTRGARPVEERERIPVYADPIQDRYVPNRRPQSHIEYRREELTITREETRVSGRHTPTKDGPRTPVYAAANPLNGRREATPDRAIHRTPEERGHSGLNQTRTIVERVSPNGRSIEERTVEYDTRPPRAIESELEQVRARIEEIKRQTQELEGVRGQLSETQKRLERTHERATNLGTQALPRQVERVPEREARTEVFYEGDTRVERTVYASPSKDLPLGSTQDRFPQKSNKFDSPLAQKSPLPERYSAGKTGLPPLPENRSILLWFVACVR